MKPYLLTLMLLAFSTSLVAQNSPVNFEADGNGADWTWEVFENTDNPALEVIDNPDATDPNTSAKVAKFTARVVGATFAGVTTDGIGTFTLDDNNRTIKIMVWKSTISDVGIKLEAAGGWSEGEIKVANTVTNQWEELTFDFSDKNNPPASEGGVFAKLTIFPDFTARSQENVIYFDNVTFGDLSSGGLAPETAAPTPTEDAANVISLFSDAYTDVAVDTWQTGWSNSGFADVTVDGNATKKYSNLNFVGIETVSSQIDASSMTHVRFDLWTPNATTFRFKIVDFGPTGGYSGEGGDGQGDDTEHELVWENPAQGEWISYDLSLTDFTGLTNTTNLAQFIFSAAPAGGTTAFIDNMYFYNADATSNEFSEVPDGFGLEQNYPNPFNPTTNISYSIPVSGKVSLDVYNLKGQKVAGLVNGVQNAGSHTVAFDASNLSSGIYVYRLTAGNSVSVKKMMLIK
ncbi:MAG: T9SS type A sorting domain-containing protein [Balneolaceae bacterium]|nr:T9SS type A sorting domain-containing protein [Balneolaceae bacterium]